MQVCLLQFADLCTCIAGIAVHLRTDGRHHLRMSARLTISVILASSVLACGATSEDPGSTKCETASWRAVGTGVSGVARFRQTAVRADSGIYVWGGVVADGSGQLPTTDTGWRIDPSAEAVDAIPTAGAPSPRQLHNSTTSPDGRYVVIYGGGASTDSFFDGGRFDTESSGWTPLAAGNEGPHLDVAFGGNVGSGWLLWGLDPERKPTAGVYLFDEDQWISAAANLPSARTGAASSEIPSTNQFLIWGGTQSPVGSGLLADGAIFDFSTSTGEWTHLESEPDVTARTGHSLVASSATDEIIVWGGIGESGELNTGERRRACGGGWMPVSNAGAPSPRGGHYAVVLGTKMIIFGGIRRDTESGLTVHLSDGGIYDLATDSWQPLPTECGPPPIDEGTFTKWSETTAVLWGSPPRESADPAEFMPERGWIFTLPQ